MSLNLCGLSGIQFVGAHCNSRKSSPISKQNVLREQPEDIYTYIADYLDALLITRENARIAAKFVEYTGEVAESIVELLATTGMPREEIDKAAETIQKSFRSWSDRKGILKEDEQTLTARIIEEAGISEEYANAAASVIQHAFASYKIRKQRQTELLSGIIDWRVAARSAIKLYRKTGVSTEEAKRAANLIKAAYQGYYTRRAMKLLQQEASTVMSEEEGSSESELDVFKKCKEVRIDYASLISRVGFADQYMFGPVLLGEDDVFEANRRRAHQEFIRSLLDEVLNKATTVADSLREDTDSEIRDIQAYEQEIQADEPTVKASVVVEPLSQADLQAGLDKAKEELQTLRMSRIGVAQQPAQTIQDITETTEPTDTTEPIQTPEPTDTSEPIQTPEPTEVTESPTE